mgnify:CR=1 FL=1
MAELMIFDIIVDDTKGVHLRKSTKVTLVKGKRPLFVISPALLTKVCIILGKAKAFALI